MNYTDEQKKTDKYCTKCKVFKKRDQFYKNRSKKDGLADWCKSCSADAQRKYVKNNRKKVNERSRNETHKLKDMAFFAYGGYICNKCGEERELCLTLDHIDNNGAEHRRKIGKSGNKILRWLSSVMPKL